MEKLDHLLERVDRGQRSHTALAVPFAVLKKYGDDEGGKFAALIAYYGFLSLFPLLLALVTIMGFVLEGNGDLQQRVLDSTLANFPIIGDQIRGNIHSLKGSGLTLAVGLAGSLWGGTGVVRAAQDAMNSLWNVPRRRRPNFLLATLRALAMLVALAVVAIAGAVLSSIGGGSSTPLVVRILLLVVSLVVNLGLFLFAFRVLTVADLSWRTVLPGAAVASVAWALLQGLGAYIVRHQLRTASNTYGFFGIVIGLLAWISLAAQITLLSAELNVVLARRLFPRAIRPPLTDAEQRALDAQVLEEERRPEQWVEAGFHHDGTTASTRDGSGPRDGDHEQERDGRAERVEGRVDRPRIDASRDASSP